MFDGLDAIRTINFEIPADPLKAIAKWAQFGWEYQRLTGEVHQLAFDLGLNIQGDPEVGWRIEIFDTETGRTYETLAEVRYFHQVIEWIFKYRCAK